MRRMIKIILLSFAAFSTSLMVIGLTMRGLSRDIAPSGKLYDVGGYKLHMDCRGENNGYPTIIFESGSSTNSPIYHHLAENLSQTHKFCTYDRAGLGWSEASGLPTKIPELSLQLNKLLEQANIKKPFVLAGHSIAGLFMKDYINRYPDDVLAIGFLDASHPDQIEAFGIKSERVDSYPFEFRILKLAINVGLTQFYNPLQLSQYELDNYPPEIVAQLNFITQRTTYIDGIFGEMSGLDASFKSTPRDLDYADLPVLVVSAGEELDSSQIGDLAPSAKEFREIWLGLQRTLAELSTSSTHIVMNSANHMSMFINKDNADIVANHIRELVKSTQL
jgi:pimeloyl-ACP methyl ester carboxylesterase